MKAFEDNKGRTWPIVVDVNAIKRVRNLLGHDLMEIAGGDMLERLAGDPVLLCDVIYCICKPQADAEKISDEDFGHAMGGDAIDAATSAMLEALVDFFPSRKRLLLNQALDKLKKLEGMAMNAIETQLASTQMEDAMEKKLQEIVESAGGNTSTSSQAPSESIPAHSASES